LREYDRGHGPLKTIQGRKFSCHLKGGRPITYNLGPISTRFRDMVSFPLKNAIFPTPNLKMLTLYCIPQTL